MKNISYLIRLVKYKIAIAVSSTSAMVYLIQNSEIDTNFWICIIGILILAMGTLSLNQVQEQKHDAQMTRTQNRPIPSNKIETKKALYFSITLCAAGLVILYQNSSLLMGLGILNLVLYNFVYTYLKRISFYSIIPGAIVGAIPLYMGWVGANGSLSDSRILFLAGFMFLWQIPHFLLILSHYNLEYENAGFVSISQKMQIGKLKYIILMWFAALYFLSILAPLYQVIELGVLYYCLIGIGAVIIFTLCYGYFKSQNIPYKLSFALVNSYMLLVYLILLLDKLIQT